MKKLEIDYWEESYKVDDISTFGNEPNAWLKKYINLFDENFSVLDIGCGDGINSIYLAKNKFNNIKAFDISQNAIEKLKRIIKKEQIKVDCWSQDIKNYIFDDNYDLVMSFGTLHFLEKEEWINFVLEMKKNTNINGYNIIQIMTNELPSTPDIAPYAVGLADDGILKELYDDPKWEIIEYSSYIINHSHFNVPEHSHSANKIIARKIK